MRKFFIDNSDTHRIELEDDQWIDILTMCSHGTKKKATAAMMKPSATGSSEADIKLSADFNAGAFNDVLLREMIVAWSFIDGDAQPVPVTPENIDRLASDITGLVLKEINALNPSPTVKEKNA